MFTILVRDPNHELAEGCNSASKTGSAWGFAGNVIRAMPDFGTSTNHTFTLHRVRTPIMLYEAEKPGLNP